MTRRADLHGVRPRLERARRAAAAAARPKKLRAARLEISRGPHVAPVVDHDSHAVFLAQTYGDSRTGRLLRSIHAEISEDHPLRYKTARKWTKTLQQLVQPFAEALQAQLLLRYRETARRRPPFEAMEQLTAWAKSKVWGAKLSFHAGAEEIEQWAELRARDCRHMAARHVTPASGYNAIKKYCEGMGLDAPPIERPYTLRGAIERAKCPRWWRRRVRSAIVRHFEFLAVDLGLTHVRAGRFASNPTVKRWRNGRARMRQLLAALVAVNERGEEVSVADAADSSVAKPEIRRNEVMTRVSGTEEAADARGDQGLFITWTLASQYHARLSPTGEANPKWQQFDPRAGQRYLRQQWGKFRSACARRKLTIYGLRVAEPHHDGTPHWHLLLWAPPEHVDEVCRLLAAYALELEPNEPGAQANRLKVERIDTERGSATGYVVKYVAKNIDGARLSGSAPDAGADNIKPDDAAESAERITAWANVWGIRQFQFFGTPPVTVWRELRRLREPLPPESPVEPARAAADAGKWSGYLEAQGGLAVPRKMQQLTLWQETTGEISAYEELKAPIVRGVRHRGIYVARGIRYTKRGRISRRPATAIFSVRPEEVRTRFHFWKIERRTSKTGTWTCVNNCTGVSAGDPGGDRYRPDRVNLWSGTDS